MPKLDAYESALFLVRLALDELDEKHDLRSQLACIRLRAALEPLEGNVELDTFEQKLIGQTGVVYRAQEK